jgi:hypothetical protein
MLDLAEDFLCEQLLIHFNRLTSEILLVLIKTILEILSVLYHETNLVNKCHREDFPALTCPLKT